MAHVKGPILCPPCTTFKRHREYFGRIEGAFDVTVGIAHIEIFEPHSESFSGHA